MKEQLTSLAEGGISLGLRQDGPLTMLSDRPFNIPVRLTNVSEVDAEWPAEGNPLHLGYRWLDEAGLRIGPEGRRTTIPSPFTRGTAVDLDAVGDVPEQPGRYRLLLSLVLEQVHWAHDVSAEGWLEVAAFVQEPPAWPAELARSRGGRALRGAMAASTIREELATTPFDVSAQPAPEPFPAPVPSPEVVARVEELASPAAILVAEPRRAGMFVRVRAWLRHLLGVPELRFAVEELLQRSAMQLEETRYLRDRIEILEASAAKAAHLATSTAKTEERVLQRLGAIEQGSDRVLKMVLSSLETKATEQRQSIQENAQSFASELRTVSEELSAKLKQLESNSTSLPSTVLKGVDQASARLLQALSAGPMVDELISGMRQSAASLRAILQQLGNLPAPTDVTPLLDQLQQLGNRPAPTDVTPLLHNLQTSSVAQSSKLDSLLTREVIPLPAAGLIFQRNRYGLLAIHDDDVPAIAYYSSGELPESGTISVVQKLLEPGDTFLDVGANVGAFTLVAARLVGSKGKVISVEPVPSTANMLRTTVAVNGISTIVEVHEVALGETSKKGFIYQGHTSGHSSLRPIVALAPETAVEVPIASGTQILKKRRPKVIKIDVEGFELEVLRGLASHLRSNTKAALIVEYSPKHIETTGLTGAQWLNELREYRSDIWVIRDEPVQLLELRKGELPPSGGANLLVCNGLPSVLQSLVGVKTRR